MTHLPTKAVILARGLGTRLREASAESLLTADQERIANAGIKALMPIGEGRVFLDLIIQNLRGAGFSEICLVIGPEHDLIRKHCDAHDLRVDFRVQDEPRGTADAVLAAEDFVAEDDLFAVVNSDNLYPTECMIKLREIAAQALLAFERSALIANSNIPENRIAKFATIDVGADGFLKRIEEKPNVIDEKSHVSMNAWLFGSAIFNACRAIKPSERGELELTSAVQYAIDLLGEKFEAIPVKAAVLDLSSRADVSALSESLRNK